MAYTPELNQSYSHGLRRIAWALNEPMTKAIERVLDDVTVKVNKDKICQSCKDKTCEICIFKGNDSRGRTQ